MSNAYKITTKLKTATIDVERVRDYPFSKNGCSFKRARSAFSGVPTRKSDTNNFFFPPTASPEDRKRTTLRHIKKTVASYRIAVVTISIFFFLPFL